MEKLNAKSLRPGLYAVTDGMLLSPERLVSAVEAALRGGAVLVQYREKTLPYPERLRQSTDLAAACRNAGVPLIINDDPALAYRVGASGVHLGQADSSLDSARQQLGDDAIIGITCHDRMDLAIAANKAGADYLAFGRFFPSTTKPDSPAASTDILRTARSLDKPVTAIGGITVQNGESLILAGADLLAVVGGLFDGNDQLIEDRAREFTRLFTANHPLF